MGLKFCFFYSKYRKLKKFLTHPRDLGYFLKYCCSFTINKSYKDGMLGQRGKAVKMFETMYYIEDIYFFELNTKYILSSAVKKISIFHECVARVKMLIFSPHEMKYFWYLPKKSKIFFLFYRLLNGNTVITTLLFTWSFLVRFDFCSVFIGYNIGCKHSLHLENGLESYFNE